MRKMKIKEIGMERNWRREDWGKMNGVDKQKGEKAGKIIKNMKELTFNRK